MADDFISLTTLEDINELINDGIEEGLNLDYKASPALARESKQIDELCKDVSALANSAGGQLIYGVEEDRATRKPTPNDPGVIDPKITREWIEQIINSKIQPRISGIRTAQIDNKKGGAIFVVTVPPSQTGPHQAPDKRYYKRFDLQSVPMEDYEVRDVLNRAVTPELFVRPGLPEGFKHRLEFKPDQEVSEGVLLSLTIGNRSKQPAEYARVLIGVDADFELLRHTFQQRRVRVLEGANYETFVAVWSVLEKKMPIFQEADHVMKEQVMLGVRSEHIHSTLFKIFIGIQSPGFSSLDRYHVHCKDAVLELRGPIKSK